MSRGAVKITVILAWLAAAGLGNIAAAAEEPYAEVVSANAACREHFWAGVSALADGKTDAAKENFDAALDVDPGCFLVYFVLSQVAYFEGDDAESTAYLQQIPPEPPELRAMYDDVAAALRADDFETVAASASQIVAAYPQTITAIAALHLLGRAQYYLGRRAEAATTIKVAYLYSGLAPGTIPAYASQVEAEEIEKFAGVE
ncbi:MAG: hypothetical protein JSU81_00020 [Candidatus Coatesbacteria bacterium]|nr:MAG: hypothetical protein JSU81_00020 [Candidatus Coatesbacteria bacterium]